MHHVVKKISFALMFATLLCFSCTPKNIEPTPNTEQPEKPNDTTSNSPVTTYNADYLFQIDALPHITIQVEIDDWNQFLRNYDQNKDNNLYIPAHFTFEKSGEQFQLDSVGLRMRGNTSRRRPEGSSGEMHSANQTDWKHFSLGIKFTEYRSKRTFCETDRISLKWHKDDATYCREVYCYDLFRRFGVWSAPRASYTRLSIHVKGDKKPAYYGVYVMVEGVQKNALKNRVKTGHLPDAEGNLWKASWGADLSNADGSRMGVETENQQYVYDLKTNEKKGLAAAKTELQGFINGMTPLQSGSKALEDFLEKRMDVDLFLRAYAVNVAVGMWDDYWVNQNNYYFYFDSQGKFYFIPYDYDNTLGTSSIINSGTQNPLYWGSRGGDRILMRKILSIAKYQELYVNYLKELTDPTKDLFDADKSIARIKRWHQIIQPYVWNDTGEDMEIKDVPAEWGNAGYYRIFEGNNQGGTNGKANFFKTKAKAIQAL